MKLGKTVFFLCALLSVMVPLLAACTSAGGIGEAVISDNVSRAGEPGRAMGTIPPDIDTIYCSIKMANPSAKSSIKAEWYLVKSDEAGLADQLIGSEAVSGGSPFVVFAFARSDKLLPRGDYQVKLYQDGKYMQSVPFKVEGQPIPSAVTLSDGVMCTDVSLIDSSPLQVVTVFPSDSSAVCCSVKLNGAKFNDRVTAVWVYIGGELAGVTEKQIAARTLKAEGRAYLSFSFGPKEGTPFPIGDYRVELYVDEKKQMSVPFSIVEWQTIRGPYVGQAVVFKYKDEERKQLDYGPGFSVETKEINFAAKIYNAPAGTEMTLRWVIVTSDEAAVDNYVLKENTEKIEGTMLATARLGITKDKFVRGNYRASLLIDGKEFVSVPFRMQ